MRALILILSIVLAITSSLLTFYYNKISTSWKKEVNDERFMRFNCEESMDKLQVRFNSVEQNLSRVNLKNQSLEKVLEQTKNYNSELKLRLDKAISINEEMKKKIQELNKISVQ